MLQDGHSQLCCLSELVFPRIPTLEKRGASLALWELQGPGELAGLVYLPPSGPLWLFWGHPGSPGEGEPEAGSGIWAFLPWKVGGCKTRLPLEASPQCLWLSARR